MQGPRRVVAAPVCLLCTYSSTHFRTCAMMPSFHSLPFFFVLVRETVAAGKQGFFCVCPGLQLLSVLSSGQIHLQYSPTRFRLLLGILLRPQGLGGNVAGGSLPAGTGFGSSYLLLTFSKLRLWLTDGKSAGSRHRKTSHSWPLVSQLEVWRAP